MQQTIEIDAKQIIDLHWSFSFYCFFLNFLNAFGENKKNRITEYNQTTLIDFEHVIMVPIQYNCFHWNFAVGFYKKNWQKKQ